MQECTARGAGLVFVVGHPEYYPRFGFVPAAEHVTLHFEQGHSLGRPTRAEVTVTVGDEGPVAVVVAATGAVVMRGSFQFNRLMLAAML